MRLMIKRACQVPEDQTENLNKGESRNVGLIQMTSTMRSALQFLSPTGENFTIKVA
jgi:hypothetical protein